MRSVSLTICPEATASSLSSRAGILGALLLKTQSSTGKRSIGSCGIMTASFNAALRGEPLLVHGDGRQTRCFTYVKDCVDGTGYEDMQWCVPDISKACAMLGYDSQTSLDLGLRETISWHRRRLADKRSG